MRIIYVLKSASESLIRYVGVTDWSCRERLLQHMSDARRGPPNPKRAWLLNCADVEICEIGVAPAGTSLVPGSARELELFWIATFLRDGHPLLNDASDVRRALLVQRGELAARAWAVAADVPRRRRHAAARA